MPLRKNLPKIRSHRSTLPISANIRDWSIRCSTEISIFLHRLIYRRSGRSTGVLTSVAQTQRLVSGLQLTTTETGFSLTNTTNRARRLIITLGSFSPSHKIYKYLQPMEILRVHSGYRSLPRKVFILPRQLKKQVHHNRIGSGTASKKSLRSSSRCQDGSCQWCK